MEWDTYRGQVLKSFQLASGIGENNPFGDSTLKLQQPVFKERGFDFEQKIANFFWGTINVGIGREIKLNRDEYQPDHTFEGVKWTNVFEGTETFHFIRCMLMFNSIGYPGYLYYPDPLTKPATNKHNYDRLEVLTSHVPALAYGDTVEVRLPRNAFVPGDDEDLRREIERRRVQSLGGGAPTLGLGA